MNAAIAQLPIFRTRYSMTASTPSPMYPDPVAVVEDWDALLRAVSTKLRLLVGDPPATEPLRTGVLECAAALEQVLVLIREQMPAIVPAAARRRRSDIDELDQ
jgi:hypothetical protein